MTIQWFPGHMAKARRQVEEKLKLVDIIYELRDARIPYSSSNPMMGDIIKNKPRLILLNKAKMADEDKTEEWINYYKDNGIIALDIDSISGYNMPKIIKKSREVLKDQLEKQQQKGLKQQNIKAMIIGIPNVGKSTFINTLAKRKVARTGDRPGVTKAQQWITVGNGLQLLDTPGILWPKFEEQKVGFKLAITGAIKDQILHLDDITIYALDFLKKNHPERLKERFKLESLPNDHIELLDRIGKKRGCLMSGGVVDYDKVFDIVLYELRNERLGRLTFELPTDIVETDTD
ncbi:ribosome biogenesis GTPase YlqF [Haloplasma contractile]|uniref:Ribosome biogenesis GTPase A n=1 Tax=Haloplasma contractile SSD-17B TaxID=1033810 RepID=U2EEX6_9MOLU|nr:Ribosome biosis GTPase A protein [Haloplasma contractile SSD-17B]